MKEKTIASLSLDLDNKWSYLKTHGDLGWESFPSYLNYVVPRILDFLAQHKLRITFFIVGQDAALPKNASVLRAIADAGHEIGNHSFHHEPWLHLFTETEIDKEIAQAEASIEKATGQRPLGFRGPGFSLSEATLRVLERRGYRYDCTTFPNYLNPLARTYYLATTKMSEEEKQRRKALFGSWRDGLRPIKPYRWQIGDSALTEIPVTTMPLIKVPIHFSYVLYLWTFSQTLAQAYFGTAMRLCRLTGTQPSLLLHPLDFMGCEDEPDLSFFPAMRARGRDKREFLDLLLKQLSQRFKCVTVGEHADAVEAAESGRIQHRRTRFQAVE